MQTCEQFARELRAYARGVFKAALGCGDEILGPRLRVTVESDSRTGNFMVSVGVDCRGWQRQLRLGSACVTRAAIEDNMHENIIDEWLAACKAKNAGGETAAQVAEHPVIGAINRMSRS